MDLERLHGAELNAADRSAINQDVIESLVARERAERGWRAARRLRKRLEVIAEEQRRAAIKRRLN